MVIQNNASLSQYQQPNSSKASAQTLSENVVKDAGEVALLRHPLYHSDGRMDRSSDVAVGSGKPSVRYMPHTRTSSSSFHTTVPTRCSENQAAHDYNSTGRMDRSSDATVTSTPPVNRFMPQPYSTVVARCSETQATQDYNLKATRNAASMPPLIQITAGDAPRFTSEANDPLPLNLTSSANHEVASETEPREDVRGYGLLPPAETADVEIARHSPTDETIATHKEKLLVRGKIYDIIPVGSGLWLLNGASDF